MKPGKPALALLAFSASMAAAMIVGLLIVRLILERAEAEFTDYVWGEPGEDDPVSPSDVSGLQEEARRITREAGP